MILLNRTNTNWWKVRKSNGVVGYMPANRVKEVEPKLLNLEKKIPVTVMEDGCKEGKGLSTNIDAQPRLSKVRLLCNVESQERDNLSSVRDESDAQEPPFKPTDSTNAGMFRATVPNVVVTHDEETPLVDTRTLNKSCST